MKTLYVIPMVLALTACGKATFTLTTPSGTTSLTVNTGSVIPSAQADITSCPAGMTLYPTISGQAAFCIDSAPYGSKVSHVQATQNCLSQGKELCSMHELQRACSATSMPTGVQYMSRTMSGANNFTVAMALDPTNCLSPNYPVDLATAWISDYYCCSN